MRPFRSKQKALAASRAAAHDEKKEFDRILDEAALDQEIDRLCAQAEKHALSGGSARGELLALLKQALTEGRRQLHRRHLEGVPSRLVVRGHSYLMDQILTRIHGIVAKGEFASDSRLCLVATGGYGRGELAPFSDIDILFLLPDANPELGKQVVQCLYLLWDLGLEVGHAVRTIDECIQESNNDLKIKTALLESRYLAGDRELFRHYHHTLFKSVLVRDREAFLRDKLAEQRERHERFGHSLFYLEPNIKENPGGLRDVHTFFWISKYRYGVSNVQSLIQKGLITEAEYRTFIRCRDFLRRVRNALHYRAGRREDRLTFNHQVEIAREFGYKDRPGMKAVEQFMRRYYQVARQIATLSQIFLLIYQEEYNALAQPTPSRHLEDAFWLTGDKISVMRANVFREDPVRLMRIFEVSQRHARAIHPMTLRYITQNLGLVNREFRRHSEVNRLFLALLAGEIGVVTALRNMHTCGVLGRFIPEFGRITGQTQHDLYHVFTVDEHTLLAVEALRNIRAGKFQEELPISTRLMQANQRPVVLYLAVLFHDIAKGRDGRGRTDRPEGDRTGEHAAIGADIAQTVCVRLGVDPEERELVAWLVRHHLVFSRTAFRRDINDPTTVAQFARAMGEVERLHLLALLTVADIRAVGPGVWTQWKASLLRQLFTAAMELLEKGLFQPQEMAPLVARKKETLLRMLGGSVDARIIQDFMNRFYPDYFLSNDPQSIARHFRFLRPVLKSYFAVNFVPKPTTGTTEMLLYSPDHPGLMAKVTGALAASGANILTANINTTNDGMALEIYELENWEGGPIDSPEKRRRIEQTLKLVIEEQVDPAKLLASSAPKRWKQETFDVPPLVAIDNQFSESYSVLEVTAKDQPGLLFTITRVLARHGIQISTAKIATYGERAVDVFYIKDIFGLKIVNDQKIKTIRDDLTRAVEELHRGLAEKKKEVVEKSTTTR